LTDVEDLVALKFLVAIQGASLQLHGTTRMLMLKVSGNREKMG